MIHVALVLKDTFAPQFASTHALLESVDYYEVILDKFSSYRFYMLSLSTFIFVLIFCKLRQIV